MAESASILVVDDNPLNLDTIKRRLERDGHIVITAADGTAGLKVLEEIAVDLVLLDIMMPKQSGYDVCQQIRARPEWNRVKIIIVSARGREAEVSKGLSLGADLYLTKPFSNAELVARIGELLGERAPSGA